MMNSRKFISIFVISLSLLPLAISARINIPVHWVLTSDGQSLAGLQCPAGQVMVGFDSTTGNLVCTPVDTNPSDDVTGSGTANYLAKWTGTNTLGNSIIYDDGTNVGIGTTSPEWKVDVRSTGDYVFHLGDNAGNDFTIDIAGGQGLVNLVAGAKVAPGTNYYVYTGTRGASRIELHDGTFYLMVGGTSGTAGSTVTWTTVMQGLSSGDAYFPNKVGIGTSTPAYSLDVAGDIRTTGDIVCTDCISLGTETVGTYVSGITAGTGISVSGTPGEGWSPTISVVFGSTAGTVAEGNKEINITAGSGLTGGGTILVGAGGTITISHADTSNQTSVDNSGNTFIQDIYLDEFGHVTGIVSATVTESDPQVGTVTDGRICYGSGGAVVCDDNLYWDAVNDRVGIGVSAPSEKLEVAGNVKASKFIDRDNVNYYIDPSNTGTSLSIAGDIYGSSDDSSMLYRVYLHPDDQFSNAPIIGLANDDLLFADKRFTIDTNVTCAGGSIQNMFDGRYNTACYIAPTAPTTYYVEITLSTTYPRHYFYAYGLRQAWMPDNGIDYLKIEIYRDADYADGWNCTEDDNVWTTIYEGDPAGAWTILKRAYYNGVCKIRFTFSVTDDADGDGKYEAYIGELMAFHAYYGQSTWPALYMGGGDMYGDINMHDNDIIDANTVQANTLEDPEDGTLTINDDLLVSGGRVTGANGEYISIGEVDDVITFATGGAERLSIKNTGVYAATEVHAKNGYGWDIYIGGDAGGNDLEIGSTTSGVTEVSFWNRADSTMMNIHAGKVYGDLECTGCVGNNEIADATKYVSVQDSAGVEQFAVTDGDNKLQFDAGAGIGIGFDPVNHKVTISNTGDTDPSDDITGSGTANYIPKFTGAQTIGDSQIYDDGTNVGIGTTSPTEKLEVAGNVKASKFIDRDNTGYYIDPSATSVLNKTCFDTSCNSQVYWDSVNGRLVIKVI